MSGLALRVLTGSFIIGRLPPDAEIPAAALSQSFFSITRTAEELSLVVPTHVDLPGAAVEAGWRVLQVLGPLDFGLTGILAGISAALAQAGVSIFALSTFDTDYVLVKGEMLERAVGALQAAGYKIAE